MLTYRKQHRDTDKTGKNPTTCSQWISPTYLIASDFSLLFVFQIFEDEYVSFYKKRIALHSGFGQGVLFSDLTDFFPLQDHLWSLNSFKSSDPFLII